MLSYNLYHSADDLHNRLHQPPSQALPGLALALHQEVLRLARLERPETPEAFGDNSHSHFEASVGSCVQRHLITEQFGDALNRAFDLCISPWGTDANPLPLVAERRAELRSLVSSAAPNAVFQRYEYENVGPWLQVNHLKTCICVMVILIRDRAKRPAVGFAPQSSPWWG